jgi:chemotaxis protein methyltransferase CheR
VTPQAFTVIADMLKKRAGLVFGPEKRYLVECRLSSVLRRHGFADLDALATSLRNGDENLSREVIEAMTTHETSFFRDVKPFETFRHVVLPQMLQRRAASRTLRILCCAASTGQEPYSLAIILSEEQNRLRGWRWEILALDISRPVLDKAREGLYTQFEVQRGLPPLYLLKYFSKSDQHWQANPELRSKVSFTYHNLLHSLANHGQFDVVFCRNVLIYFDTETKTRTLQNIHLLWRKTVVSCLAVPKQ